MEQLCFTHFISTEEETSWEHGTACLRPHSWEVAEAGFEHTSVGAGGHTVSPSLTPAQVLWSPAAGEAGQGTAEPRGNLAMALPARYPPCSQHSPGGLTATRWPCCHLLPWWHICPRSYRWWPPPPPQAEGPASSATWHAAVVEVETVRLRVRRLGSLALPPTSWVASGKPFHLPDGDQGQWQWPSEPLSSGLDHWGALEAEPVSMARPHLQGVRCTQPGLP